MSNRRPWQRTAIKLGATLLGPRRRHYHGWWPHLELRRASGKTTIVYRKNTIAELCSVALLADHAAREIVIVGSGPSIKQTAIERLSKQSAILLNGAISLIPQRLESPLAIAFEDERFIWRHFPLVRQSVSPQTPLLLSVPVIRAICEIDSEFLRGRRILLIDNLRKPYGRPRPSNAELDRMPFVALRAEGRYGFSRDPEAGIFMSHSVAVSAFQFAVACKPKLIGLAGIDLSNDTQPRFYEQAGRTEPSGLSGSLEYILGHIALARDCAAEMGIRFSNYSPTSALSNIDIGYDPALALNSADENTLLDI